MKGFNAKGVEQFLNTKNLIKLPDFNYGKKKRLDASNIKTKTYVSLDQN